MQNCLVDLVQVVGHSTRGLLGRHLLVGDEGGGTGSNEPIRADSVHDAILLRGQELATREEPMVALLLNYGGAAHTILMGLLLRLRLH
jgi:hypothetical protein